ncbi:MAG: c-type cytochrome domain-containing protein [Bacteroidota bacterium]|nr:c-type cytochrome domain-containing protein [Bacteroidota bacterium]
MFLTITEFIGRFHVLLVHLPIGFLLIGLLLQWLSVHEKYQISKEVIKVIIFCGMIAAVFSCITGYLLSLSGDYNESLLGWHMWMGISVASISFLLFARLISGRLDIWYKVLSVALLIVIFITGHLGGSLTHGSDYLTGPLSDEPDSVVIVRKIIPDIQEANVYADVIQPMLQTRCYTCHSNKKQKNNLRLDSPDWILKGGKNGPVLDANPEESKMLKRILLPREDDDHMPPKQKPQFTEKQIALIHWWIDQGADFNKKVKDLQQPQLIQPYLLALQSDHLEKKAIPIIPTEPVEKADEKSLQPLIDKGAIIIPVSKSSNYLMANFVSAINITGKDIKLLLPVKKQLAWLKLNDTNVGDSALSVVGQCTNLTLLQLNNTKITDKGLGLIKNLNKLQSISLVGTKVTGKGVLQLQSIKGLQSIYLYKTAANKNDWPALKKAFPKTEIDSGGYIVPLLATDTTLVKTPKSVK